MTSIPLLRMLTFSDVSALAAYAAAKHYPLEHEEPKRHDLDWAVTCLSRAIPAVDCVEALAAWNLFSDVALSIHGAGRAFEELDKQSRAIYEKLFWGNNLPSLTPEGCHFDPEWSSDEITVLATVLRAGLEMFRSRALPVK
jgi:hypothetical protein